MRTAHVKTGPRRFTYQRVFEGNQALPFPFSLKHVGKVLRARTENAAVGRKHLPVNGELHVAVLSLLPQPKGKEHLIRLDGRAGGRQRAPFTARQEKKACGGKARDPHVKNVGHVPALHGAHTDALVLLEQAANGVTERAVHAPLPVEGVGFALGS